MGGVREGVAPAERGVLSDHPFWPGPRNRQFGRHLQVRRFIERRLLVLTR